MTLQEIQALTDDEIRVRVGTIIGYDCDPAEAREWGSRGQWVVKPGAVTRNLTSLRMDLPNYHADLNACHEAILACGFSIHQQDQFSFELWKIIRLYRQASTDKVGSIDFLAVNATARQRCEAFLAVMQP